MGKRSNLFRMLTLSVSIAWGASELLALQRVYMSSRMAKLRTLRV